MKTVIRIGNRVKPTHETGLEKISGMEIDAKLELIQSLIPLGLLHVEEELKKEVERLAGPRHSRGAGLPGHVRWGRQGGSVFLLDQKVPMSVPRVRDRARGTEVPLSFYQSMQTPRRGDEGLLLRVLRGISCRSYKTAAEAIPEVLGMSPSSVSRRFVQVSARKLKDLMERDLSGHDFVALVLDGKAFGKSCEMVTALGITLDGKKIVLGFVETVTENEAVCTEFLRGLVDRGFSFEKGLLVALDGAKGLRKAVDRVFAGRALVQRCQWHKRENVVRYLGEKQRKTVRGRLQQAYNRPTLAEAKAALLRVKKELSLQNESAVRSLEEGFEETLTLHRLGLFRELGISLKTTNSIESLHSLIASRTDKVDHWKNSNQRQRWVATALLDIEPGLRRIKGFRHLPALRQALQVELNLVSNQNEKLA
ncbi:MAG TPA: transposase [Nitrospiraceae bacterium]|nr:transposase [Nitrospiraceae bacterium]